MQLSGGNNRIRRDTNACAGPVQAESTSGSDRLSCASFPLPPVWLHVLSLHWGLRLFVFEPAEPLSWPMDIAVCAGLKVCILGNSQNCVASREEEVLHILKHHLGCTVIAVQGELPHREHCLRLVCVSPPRHPYPTGKLFMKSKLIYPTNLRVTSSVSSFGFSCVPR